MLKAGYNGQRYTSLSWVSSAFEKQVVLYSMLIVEHFFKDCNSPFRFGDGYMINVRCEVESVSEILLCVQSAIPEAKLREKRSRQLIWHIGPNILSISTLFNKMEAARATTDMVIWSADDAKSSFLDTNVVILQIDYSITQTTLDDVFVRFARLQRETNGKISDQGQIIMTELPRISRLTYAIFKIT